MTLPPAPQYIAMGKLHAQGFETLKMFPGEYTLMIKFPGAHKARVYEDGTVQKINPKTGEFETVEL